MSGGGLGRAARACGAFPRPPVMKRELGAGALTLLHVHVCVCARALVYMRQRERGRELIEGQEVADRKAEH